MIGEQGQAVVAGELQGQVDQGRGGATVGRGVLCRDGLWHGQVFLQAQELQAQAFAG